jgi:hypothetical protein
MISRESLEEFFERTRQLLRSGQAHFNIDDICLWSYFFTDRDRLRLEPVANYLSGRGYTIWGYLDPKDEGTGGIHFLRADRFERHTVDSLEERNRELYAVADKFEVGSYDGMDVGGFDAP